MATKTPAKKSKGKASKDGSSKPRKVSKTSRKTVRKTTAPMARKSDGDGDDKDKATKPAAKAEDKKPAAKAEDKQPAAKAEDKQPAAKPAPKPAPAKPAPPPASEFAELLPPRAIEDWDPDSDAPPPGKAPPGDSRSFRRFHEGVEEFVLIYRFNSFLITRSGKVGKQGTWNIVEYPHVGLAANAYAHKCSDLTGAGYRDLR